MIRLLVIVTAVACTAAFTKDTKRLSDAGIATCESPSEGGGTSKWVRSKAGFSAAVQLRSRVVGSESNRHCTTAWVLKVRGKNGQEHSISVAEREDSPEDNEWAQENSFEIDAWSADGSLLLASQSEAQGDWDETTPIVYDFRVRKYWRVPLRPLFEKHIPTDCYVVYRAMRFDSAGKIIVSALSTDADRKPGTQPCFPESLWKLDFRHRTIAPAGALTRSKR